MRRIGLAILFALVASASAPVEAQAPKQRAVALTMTVVGSPNRGAVVQVVLDRASGPRSALGDRRVWLRLPPGASIDSADGRITASALRIGDRIAARVVRARRRAKRRLVARSARMSRTSPAVTFDELADLKARVMAAAARGNSALARIRAIASSGPVAYADVGSVTAAFLSIRGELAVLSRQFDFFADAFDDQADVLLTRSRRLGPGLAAAADELVLKSDDMAELATRTRRLSATARRAISELDDVVAFLAAAAADIESGSASGPTPIPLAPTASPSGVSPPASEPPSTEEPSTEEPGTEQPGTEPGKPREDSTGDETEDPPVAP